MTTDRIRWRLRLGERIIAEIADDEYVDWPWTYGRLVNSPEFEHYRKYFTDMDTDDDSDDSEIDALIAEINSLGPIALHDEETDRTYENPTINQDGDAIWFRLHLDD